MLKRKLFIVLFSALLLSLNASAFAESTKASTMLVMGINSTKALSINTDGSANHFEELRMAPIIRNNTVLIPSMLLMDSRITGYCGLSNYYNSGTWDFSIFYNWNGLNTDDITTGRTLRLQTNNYTAGIYETDAKKTLPDELDSTAPQDPKFLYNGPINLKQCPVSEGDINIRDVFLPKDLVEKFFGIKIYWNPDKEQLIIGNENYSEEQLRNEYIKMLKDSDPSIVLKIGSNDFSAIGGAKLDYTTTSKLPDQFISSKKMDVSPILRNDRAFVPVRFICEELGFKVDYNANTQTVVLTKNDIRIELQIGKLDPIVFGVDPELAQLDTAPFIQNGRTMVPLRFLTQILKKSISWKEKLKQITIGDDYLGLLDVLKLK